MRGEEANQGAALLYHNLIFILAPFKGSASASGSDAAVPVVEQKILPRHLHARPMVKLSNVLTENKTNAHAAVLLHGEILNEF